ncbi:hypothetical protein [Novosphingobium sp. MMS21-SN21R]|uniref:hypothetical protein n=1 Tax=Novosphingobium sp. MMS21-SN21R TaxID=2969298 RepID=UPI0028866073|nr:hypothetical protein [Novosphingobium sp. MMS21-SN21R]MDT0509248.1 hypothetical protein [Novosphingobium sp. MMS21-SN21R]
MLFRIFLVGVWAALVAFTVVVAANHGLNLFPVFFGDMAKGAWPGQFNADFTSLLALSGLWCAWRGKWSPAAIAHGLITFVGGGVVLFATLFVLHRRHGGDMRKVLLGAQA